MMKKPNFKQLSMIGAATSVLLFSGCTPTEQAITAGVATAVIVGSFDHPRYYDRPYYHYNN
ncbi:MAG: hypothetical protein P8Y49_04275, partial [Sulfurovaceae bacterium]